MAKTHTHGHLTMPIEEEQILTLISISKISKREEEMEKKIIMATVLDMTSIMPMITLTAWTTVSMVTTTDFIMELVTAWTTDSVLITASTMASITA